MSPSELLATSAPEHPQTDEAQDETRSKQVRVQQVTFHGELLVKNLYFAASDPHLPMDFSKSLGDDSVRESVCAPRQLA